uniref:F-box family protein n=1 Tax=Solanum tuberosum TaxID=4113 RepID=M1DI56_SOLTU
MLLSRGQNWNVNFPSMERICATTASQNFEQRKYPSIEILPDECLFEVFKRLPSGQERSVYACVSKRWLMLLSNIHKDEIAEYNGIEGEGYLVRSLFGKEATYVRLAAIAIGTANHGGLAKLSIQGNNPCLSVTDAGLVAIARGCPTLRDLSLWNVSFVGDKGLSEIAHGCHLLEKLDLFKCPIITDKSLLDIAKNCPDMTSLTIDSCSNIGNESLKAVGQYCPNLSEPEDFRIKEFSTHWGSWISSSILFSCCIDVEDYPLTLVASCRNSLVSLAIHNCPRVGNTTIDVVGGLCRKLTHIDQSGLLRITDEGLIPLVQNCAANLVAVNLSRCVNITDISVSTIVKLNGGSLKSLLVDGCRHVTDATLVEILKSCRMLNVLDVSKSGITDSGSKTLANATQLHLQILSLSGCPFVSDNSLPFLLDLVQNLQGLNIQHCLEISSRTVDALVEINPICDILS